MSDFLWYQTYSTQKVFGLVNVELEFPVNVNVVPAALPSVAS